MAFEKIWLGTNSSVATLATNWQAISVRNAGYSWTASGSGTNEYYLRTAANGNPGITAQPGNVLINGSAATEGTMGSLTAGQWDYGDNDTLGYSTIYVRLSGGGDPDAQARDHVQFQAIPTAGDHVTLSASAIRGIDGVDWSSIAIGDFFIESGYKNLGVGSQLTPLRIDPDSFIVEGSGGVAWYIDLTTATINIEIRNCPRPANGYGLYLIGSGLGTVTHDAGALAIAGQPGDTATVGTFISRSSQALWLLDSGVTLTTLRNFAGTGIIRCNATTVNVDAGQVTTELTAAFTTLNVRGGTVIEKGNGTQTSVVLDGGTYDTMPVRAAKTLTAMQHNAGTFLENVDLIAIATRTEPAYPGVVQRTRF